MKADNLALETLTNENMEGIKVPSQGELALESTKCRSCANLVAYWILGLCNNFGYVVMLSAAHDILSSSFNEAVTDAEPTNNGTRDCNPTSTGAILLADIIPALTIKVLAPFFPFFVHVRMLLVILLGVLGYLLVAFSTAEWMAIMGVICTSLASGLGEVTLLAYSSVFDTNVISTWSSGTGAAGIFGAGSYAGLTSIGLSPRNCLLVMLLIPGLMAVAFWVMLREPGASTILTCCQHAETNQTGDDIMSKSDEDSSPSVPEVARSAPSLTLVEKFRCIPPLLKYMIPIGLVYLFEYFINQGLFELIYFEDIWLNHHEQYRWLQVDYQIGVFLSRSSVNLFVIRKIWLMAILQLVNVVLFAFEAVYLFVPNIWIVFAAVLWEGLLGGAAYVNTFYRISVEVPYEKREFSLGITSLADSVGIGLAGAFAIPVHKVLCGLPKPS